MLQVNPRPYFVASGALFTLVAIAHLVRAIYGWQVVIGNYSVPNTVSWVAFIITASLALWAVQLASRTRQR